MKKYIILFILFISITSCVKEDNVTKEEEEKEVIDNKLGDLKDLLASSLYGWKTICHVKTPKDYTLYYSFRFQKDLQLGIFSESNPDYIMSKYSIEDKDGILWLSFDRQDPNIPWITEGRGVESDYSVISSSDDEIILEGKINKIKMVLNRSDINDISLDLIIKNKSYLTDCYKYRKTNLVITNGIGKDKDYIFDVGIYSDLSTMTFSTYVNAKLQEQKNSICITPKEIILIKPVIVMGKEFSSLTYNTDKDRFEIADDTIEGYIVNTRFSLLAVPGVANILLDKSSTFNFTQQVVASSNLKEDIKTILFDSEYKSIRLVTNFSHDDKKWTGLLLSKALDGMDKYLFVPFTINKISEDRIKIVFEGEILSNIDNHNDFVENNTAFSHLKNMLSCKAGIFLDYSKLDIGFMMSFVNLDDDTTYLSLKAK